MRMFLCLLGLIGPGFSWISFTITKTLCLRFKKLSFFTNSFDYNLKFYVQGLKAYEAFNPSHGFTYSRFFILAKFFGRSISKVSLIPLLNHLIPLKWKNLSTRCWKRGRMWSSATWTYFFSWSRKSFEFHFS